MKQFESGDIIMMDFNLTKEHEQAGNHPAIIISNQDFSRFMKLAIVCPITNIMKPFPVHIPLDHRTKTTGCILCGHVRTVDLTQRNAKFIEKIPSDIFGEIIDIVESFF